MAVVSTHPVVLAGVSAASLTALLGPASSYVLAVPGAILASIMLFQMATNKPGWLGSVVARIKAVWTADRPYIAAAALMIYGGCVQYGIQLPPLAVAMLGALGLANLHASTKGTPK